MVPNIDRAVDEAARFDLPGTDMSGGDMTPAPLHPTGAPQSDAVHDLCSMLLEIAGRDTNRLPSVIRHTRILDQALVHMVPDQKAEALARIRRLQTKWGCLFAEAETEAESYAIPPETRVARWASERSPPEVYIGIMHDAARAVLAGQTSLSWILDAGFKQVSCLTIRYPSDYSFMEWLFQLRIARRETKGVYVPGHLCRWWVEEMEPSRDRHSTYAACLKQMWQYRDESKGR